MSINKLLIAMTLGLALAACSPTTQVHGYVPSPTDIASVRAGVDTKETVTTKLGRPSSSALLNDTAWYYVQSVVENYTYHAPRVVDIIGIAHKKRQQ